MVTDGSYTYYDEHREMYRIVRSLCCAPKINITLYMNYTSIKNIFVYKAGTGLEINIHLKSNLKKDNFK